MKPHLLLKRHFEKKKKERASFSLRFLAKRINISPAFLSQMLSGKRGISLEVMEQLCDQLDIDHENRDFLIASVLQEKGLKRTKASVVGSLKAQPPRRTDWQLAPKKKFRLLNPWHVIAVADATLLRGYDGTAKWVAKKLGLTLEEAEKAFTMLKEEGLLVEKNGRLEKIARFVEFSSSATDEIRGFHQGQMENTLKALKNGSAQAREKRLITGMIITGAKKDIDWAKQRLLSALHEISERLGSSEPEELFQVSLQFLPIQPGTDS